MSGEIFDGARVGPVGGEVIHEIIATLAKRMAVHELAGLPLMGLFTVLNSAKASSRVVKQLV